MYSRPSLAEIIQRVRNDVLSRLAADEVLRRADAEVYARVMSGVAHGLYGFIEWLSDQVIYDRADDEFLRRWRSLWGVPDKNAAVATGSVTFTVQAGAVIQAGTTLQALDGVQYQTSADAVVALPNATAPITALLAGKAGNRDAGQALALVSPVPGVQPTALAGAISGGADAETPDEERARLLARIRQPPHGGAAHDYVAWGLEVPGVTRVWVTDLELGYGTVTVRFVRDNDGAGAAIIPDAAEVAAVQAYIDARRPVGMEVFVVAPVSVPLDFEIDGLSPATLAVKDAIRAELQDLLLREAVPGGVVLISHIRAAISAATGEVDYVLVSPTADVASAAGSMSVMGDIEWT